MSLIEWKAYRNIRIKEDKDSIKSVSQKLGIDIMLAREILNGTYDHQTREWERMGKNKLIKEKLI